MVAFTLATICNTFISSLFLSKISYRNRVLQGSVLSVGFDDSSRVNYHQLNNVVVDRNLFNKEGEVPDEAEEQSAQANEDLFSEDAPCQKTSLNIKLLGIIYISVKGRSLVTIQEKGYNEADVYSEGDEIIGQPGVTVFGIEPQLVVLNNNGRKECMEPEKPTLPEANDSIDFASSSSSEDSGQVKTAKLSHKCSNIRLTETYVNDQLGDGFEKMINSGRLIPHNVDGQLVGFRLIGVKSGTIFGRLCLKTGDVLTKVNQMSLSQPEQGFTFYEVFQNDREIRLEYLQGGERAAVATVIVEEG